MLKMLKSASDGLVSKIARVLPRFNPNFITIAGLLPPILFFWLLTHNFYGWALLALSATALDSIDGAYARATGQTTKFGAFLDSTLDRIADSIIISAFGFAGLVCWEIVVALLIASFLISFVRSAGTIIMQDSKLLAVGPIERAPRLIIIGIGLLFYIVNSSYVIQNYSGLEIIFSLLLALSIITIIRRIFIIKNMRA